MHELSLAQEIIKILEEQIGLHRVTKVHMVKVKVGKLMSVVPSSLLFCFEIASQGTKLEGVKLEIEEIPVRCFCQRCRKEFIVESFVFSCPKCQGTDLKQISGNEFYIHSMEVD